MDDAMTSSAGWAASGIGYGSPLFEEGLSFIGYPILSEMGQRPEYRQISETIARHMTRNWITLKSKSGEDKSERIDQLVTAMGRFGIANAFRRVTELDGLFGRGHLYIDLGTTDDPVELRTSIGDGWNNASKGKVVKGTLKAVRVIEPVWCYPSQYNSSNPLAADWYKPTTWYVMGTEVHATRLLPFVSREVSDLLKSAYAFGGLSLSQMCKPAVDNWLRTRQSVSDIVNAFSVFVLKTDVTDSLAAQGDSLFRRAEIFNNCRDNNGLMLVDKETEDFVNVAANLGTLDQLQAQSQEHMSAVSGIPLVELLGIQPAGLNASSEGELKTFEGRMRGMQEHLFRAPLTMILGILMLNEFGEVDPDIVFEFNPLWTLDEKELREKQLSEAQTDQILVDSGIVDVIEVRKNLSADPDSRYAGIDVDDVPVPAPSELDDSDSDTPPAPKKPREDDGDGGV